MKPTVALFAGILVLLLIDCGKGGGGTPAFDVQGALENAGIVAVPSTALVEITPEGLANPMKALRFGSPVKIRPEVPPKSLQDSSGQKITFVQVEGGGAANDHPLWIRADHWAGEGALAAVVLQTATALDGPGAGKSLAELPLGSLVAITTKRAERGYVQGYLWSLAGKPNPLNGTFPAVWVPQDLLSSTPGDLLAGFALTQEPAEREALLKEAYQSYGSSPLLDEERGLATGQEGEPAAEPLNMKLSVAHAAASVFEKPSSRSRVVGHLDMDEEVEVVARTTQALEGAGSKAHWYQIEGSLPGWVFGTDLVGAE